MSHQKFYFIIPLKRIAKLFRKKIKFPRLCFCLNIYLLPPIYIYLVFLEFLLRFAGGAGWLCGKYMGMLENWFLRIRKISLSLGLNQWMRKSSFVLISLMICVIKTFIFHISSWGIYCRKTVCTFFLFFLIDK